MEKKLLRMTVNGEACEVYIPPKKLLVEVLRDELGFNGTKRGCNTGACCSCTVLLDGITVKSCSVLAMQADGAEVTTVEGLSPDGKLHPIQEAFVEEHGLQCGFCTPGFLMSVYELLYDNPSPSDEEIEDMLSGQICRCTGYQSILRAVRVAAEKLQAAPSASTTPRA